MTPCRTEKVDFSKKLKKTNKNKKKQNHQKKQIDRKNHQKKQEKTKKTKTKTAENAGFVFFWFFFLFFPWFWFSSLFFCLLWFFFFVKPYILCVVGLISIWVLSCFLVSGCSFHLGSLMIYDVPLWNYCPNIFTQKKKSRSIPPDWPNKSLRILIYGTP